jgi:hypothetical protein
MQDIPKQNHYAMESKFWALFLFLLCSLTGFSQDNSDYIIQDSIVIKTKSNAEICVTVARNKSVTTAQPCILYYNIYADTSQNSIEGAKWVAAKGYVAVEANTRGKRCSQNAIEPFEHDAEDAWYIIDWISKQPWCNGKVGMVGGSYLGFSQWSATKHLHPALKTIVPQVAVGAGIDFPRQNGINMTYMLRWIHYVTDNKLTNEKVFEDSTKWNSLFNNWYKNGNKFASLDSLEGNHNKIFQRWLQHSRYDAYWQKMIPYQKEFGEINIPVLTITGYWDDDQLGAMYYFKQHHFYNKNANHYLVIGPYSHNGYSKVLGGYAIDSIAKEGQDEIIFQWFNYILKDSTRPAILKDKINFEVLGDNKWMHVSSLDKMHNDSLIFYLNNVATNNNYSLIDTRPKQLNSIEQVVDLTDRATFKETGEEIMAFPSLLVDSIKTYPELLRFETKPFESSFILSGSFIANLVISINKKDVDIVIDLYDQLPNGKYLALSRNIQRASHAKDKTTLLHPNQTEIIKLENTFITCKKIEKRSKLVAVIGVNKNQNWEINYGTGKDVSQEDISDAKTPMKIKWYNSSFLNLKILK